MKEDLKEVINCQKTNIEFFLAIVLVFTIGVNIKSTIYGSKSAMTLVSVSVSTILQFGGAALLFRTVLEQ